LGAHPHALTVADDWHTYRDGQLGFSVRYPPSVVRLPEDEPPPERRPHLLRRVRLLDRELARSDTAALQPPTLAIEVHSDDGLALADWLDQNDRGAGMGAVERMDTQGASEALRVRSRDLSAPNVFLYYRARAAVVLLVPLGADGESSARTFRWD